MTRKDAARIQQYLDQATAALREGLCEEMREVLQATTDEWAEQVNQAIDHLHKRIQVLSTQVDLMQAQRLRDLKRREQ